MKVLVTTLSLLLVIGSPLRAEAASCGISSDVLIGSPGRVKLVDKANRHSLSLSLADVVSAKAHGPKPIALPNTLLLADLQARQLDAFAGLAPEQPAATSNDSRTVVVLSNPVFDRTTALQVKSLVRIRGVSNGCGRYEVNE